MEIEPDTNEPAAAAVDSTDNTPNQALCQNLMCTLEGVFAGKIAVENYEIHPLQAVRGPTSVILMGKLGD